MKANAWLVTKAMLHAAKQLNLSPQQLPRVLSTHWDALPPVPGNEAVIDPDSKEGEAGLLVVRLYRLLMGLVGNDAAKARLWLQSDNTFLGGMPADLIADVEGLDRVVGYLELLRVHA